MYVYWLVWPSIIFTLNIIKQAVFEKKLNLMLSEEMQIIKKNIKKVLKKCK